MGYSRIPVMKGAIPMPRAMILLPLLLIIQVSILCLLLRLVWRLFRRWDRQDQEDRF